MRSPDQMSRCSRKLQLIHHVHHPHYLLTSTWATDETSSMFKFLISIIIIIIVCQPHHQNRTTTNTTWLIGCSCSAAGSFLPEKRISPDIYIHLLWCIWLSTWRFSSIHPSQWLTTTSGAFDPDRASATPMMTTTSQAAYSLSSICHTKDYIVQAIYVIFTSSGRRYLDIVTDDYYDSFVHSSLYLIHMVFINPHRTAHFSSIQWASASLMPARWCWQKNDRTFISILTSWWFSMHAFNELRFVLLSPISFRYRCRHASPSCICIGGQVRYPVLPSSIAKQINQEWKILRYFGSGEQSGIPQLHWCYLIRNRQEWRVKSPSFPIDKISNFRKNGTNREWEMRKEDPAGDRFCLSGQRMIGQSTWQRPWWRSFPNPLQTTLLLSGIWPTMKLASDLLLLK